MEDIVLTPNFAALFARFLVDLQSAGQSLTSSIRAAQFEAYPETATAIAQHAAVMRAIQHLLAPLVICLQSATSAAEIERLREVAANILSRVDTDATGLENEAHARTETFRNVPTRRGRQ